MTKENFLNALSEYIGVLSETDIEKALSYYSEIIDDYTENGLSEEEAIQKIGDVKETANKIIAESTGEIKPESKLGKFISNIFKLSNSKWRMLIFAILMLGFPLWIWVILPILMVLLIVVIGVCVIPLILLYGSVVFFWTPFIDFTRLNPLGFFWYIGKSLVWFGAAAFYISCFTTMSKIIYRHFKKLSIKIKKLKLSKKAEK